MAIISSSYALSASFAYTYYRITDLLQSFHLYEKLNKWINNAQFQTARNRTAPADVR